MNEFSKLYQSARFPLIASGIMFFMYILDTWAPYTNYDLFLLRPRDGRHLIGIITTPFFHGSFEHLFMNISPFVILGTAINHFYSRVSTSVWIFIWLGSGLGVWLWGRDSFHIGSSGIIYGFAGFLLLSGVLRKSSVSLALSAIVLVLYGGIFEGLFPQKEHISYEAHLTGFIMGIITSLLYRKVPMSIADAVPIHTAFTPQETVLRNGFKNIENSLYKYEYTETSEERVPKQGYIVYPTSSLSKTSKLKVWLKRILQHT